MHQLLLLVLRLLVLVSLEVFVWSWLPVVASLCEVILHIKPVNLVKDY